MIPWDKLHGAMTHFPIALLMFSTACDFVSVAFKKLSFARGLRLVSFYGLAFAALASLGAVVSIQVIDSRSIPYWKDAVPGVVGAVTLNVKVFCWPVAIESVPERFTRGTPKGQAPDIGRHPSL